MPKPSPPSPCSQPAHVRSANTPLALATVARARGVTSLWGPAAFAPSAAPSLTALRTSPGRLAGKRQKCMHATSRMHMSSAHEHPPLVETACRRSRATLAFTFPNSYSHNAALEARQREFDEENTRNAVDSFSIILAVNSRKQGSWFVSLSTPTPRQNIAPQLSGCACGCI